MDAEYADHYNKNFLECTKPLNLYPGKSSLEVGPGYEYQKVHTGYNSIKHLPDPGYKIHTSPVCDVLQVQTNSLNFLS